MDIGAELLCGGAFDSQVAVLAGQFLVPRVHGALGHQGTPVRIDQKPHQKQTRRRTDDHPGDTPLGQEFPVKRHRRMFRQGRILRA